MGLGLLSKVNRVISPMGFEIRKAPVWRQGSDYRVPAGSRLYVGCGEDRREGFLGCDVRPLATVDLVCKAWEVSAACSDLKEIYSRHMVEHLTFGEMQTTLADWYRALAPGGSVHIIVPDMDFHVAQWVRANWETWDDTKSDAAWGAAGFYGWQRDCNPEKPGYETSYWDVHKSGYTTKSLRFFLERAGFQQITTEVQDECHLVGKGVKGS